MSYVFLCVKKKKCFELNSVILNGAKIYQTQHLMTAVLAGPYPDLLMELLL